MRLLLIIIFLPNLLYANIAIDQLNRSLEQKKIISVKTTSTRLKDLSQNYYLVFIYKSTCPHCHNFAPVLLDFTKTFAVEMKTYSLDQQSLAGLKAQTLSPELFKNFYSDYRPVVPALFLVNTHTLQAYAVLFGEATPAQLANRIDSLLTRIEGNFNA